MSNRPRLPMTEEKELTDEECASAIANDLSLSTDDLLLEIYKEAANTAQKAGPQMAKTTAKSAILSLSIIKEQALIHHQLARLTRYLTWLTVMLAILTLGLLGVWAQWMRPEGGPVGLNIFARPWPLSFWPTGSSFPQMLILCLIGSQKKNDFPSRHHE